MLYVFRDYKVLAFIVRDFWKLPHEEIKITHKSFIDIKKKKRFTHYTYSDLFKKIKHLVMLKQTSNIIPVLILFFHLNLVSH